MTKMLLVSLLVIASFMPKAANASTSSPGNAALSWAEANATGHPYVWAGAGPYGYDCSGLVSAAFAHVGLQLPHSTYEMLSSRHLISVGVPQRGDLAFYGSGHVEFVTGWYHTTFGAHDYGSTVGWIRWGYGWVPTMFFKVVW